MALDGYGTINVNNQTGYDIIIKGLDTGIGSKGVVIITDTSKTKQVGNKTYYQATKYEREGNQVKVTTWYVDDTGNKIDEKTTWANQNNAKYQPTQGLRYDWVGQSVTEKRIETYCTKTWLGID